MRRLTSWIAQLTLCALCCSPELAWSQVDSIRALPTDLGVPQSPAFELLGVSPGETPHIVSAHDFQTNVEQFFQGAHLKPGASVDARPLSFLVHSLQSYQKHAALRWLWRTVASAGTTAASKDSKDVLLAGGLRFPILDGSDPRADPALTGQLQENFAACTIAQPSLSDSLKDIADLYAPCGKRADSVRAQFQKASWSRISVDVGLAGSLRSAGGDFHLDSLSKDRYGMWVGLRRGIGSTIRATVGIKALTLHADSATQPSSELSGGARAEWFAREHFGLSVEATRVNQRYRDSTQLNDGWWHPAVIAEWAPPLIGGWVGLGLGGDTSHRTKSGAQLSLFYAAYKDRIIKP